MFLLYLYAYKVLLKSGVFLYKKLTAYFLSNLIFYCYFKALKPFLITLHTKLSTAFVEKKPITHTPKNIAIRDTYNQYKSIAWKENINHLLSCKN